MTRFFILPMLVLSGMGVQVAQAQDYIGRDDSVKAPVHTRSYMKHVFPPVDGLPPSMTPDELRAKYGVGTSAVPVQPVKAEPVFVAIPAPTVKPDVPVRVADPVVDDNAEDLPMAESTPAREPIELSDDEYVDISDEYSASSKEAINPPEVDEETVYDIENDINAIANALFDLPAEDIQEFAEEPPMPVLAQINYPKDEIRLDAKTRDAMENLVLPKLRMSGASRIALYSYAESDRHGANAERLSLSRALQLRSFLISHGVDPSMIEIYSLGDGGLSLEMDRVDIKLSL
jgi:outer membrane protein OmpA-like peptidoglycan-associated protein